MTASRNPHWQRLALLKLCKGRLLLGLLCMGVTVAVQLAFPQALSYFIDHVGQRHDSGWYLQLGLAALGVLAVHTVAATLRFYLFDSAGHLIVTAIRRRMFDALIGQPVAYFDRHHAGELASRLAADVEVLHETLTMGLAVALRAACVLAGAVAMLVSLSPVMSLMMALFAPAILYLGKRAGASYRLRAGAMQQSLAACGKTAQEHFTHVRLVHAFNQQRLASSRYGGVTGAVLEQALLFARTSALFRGGASLLLYTALLLTIWLGAYLIGQGSLTIGGLAAFVLYASMVTESAGAVSEFWNAWMRTLGATDEVFAILAGVAPTAPAPAPLVLKGAVTFDAVCFAYPERPDSLALAQAGFTIAAGEKVALVGASGAGKSTIASLILGLYRPTGGRILLDGMDAATLDTASVRRHLAIVEQEPALFSGSIHDNIAFALQGGQASPAQVERVARLAQAHDFIMAFPDGYETLVGERGTQLSGGQKQRIAIARALLCDPRILILDEATSALDTASEQLVQRALDTLMEGRTTLIIAHRYATIVKADRVIVLEQGRVVQQGSHAELREQTDGAYLRLMRHQLASYRNLAEQLQEA
jgi:ATP-binding cassette subfamily B protein